jgi:hypothetical protein
MMLNADKTKVNSFRKTYMLTFNYILCNSCILPTNCIKGLCVFLNSKLYFHVHADYLFSHTIKALGLIRRKTFSSPSLDTLLMLHISTFTMKLEHASVVCNSHTNADFGKLYTLCYTTDSLKTVIRAVILVFRVT